MNDQQKQEALNPIQRHWGNKSCPCCDHNSCSLNDKLAMMPHVADDSITWGQDMLSLLVNAGIVVTAYFLML